MSQKHFSWLLIITLVVAGLIFLLPGGTSKDSEFEVQALLPELAAHVNSIDRVQVSTAGNKTIATLKRQDGAWVVEEFQNYPADWPKLRELLSALAKARVIEPKTDKPEYFPRLGLSDIADEDSKATQLQLTGEGSDITLLVGNAAEGREGQYVRLLDGDQALLIDRQLTLPAEARDWLQRNIIDVSDAEVVEFSVVHADGSRLEASKASADDDNFTLQDIPAGREILSAWSVNSIANALSNLQLDAVAPVDSVDFSTATRFQLLTAGGLQVLAELTKVDEQNWLRITASPYEQDGADDSANTDAAESESESKRDPDAVAKDAKAEEVAHTGGKDADEPEVDAAERAKEINQRVSGWAYAIPAYKADVMTKRLDDLLKALPEPE